MIKVKTNKGDLTIQLDFENTPNTANNFLRCVEEGYFDGTIFHRVIDGFMIQGGGFEPGMVKKPSRAPINNEANKAKSNKRGSLAMARTTDPHSASTQFFINVKDNSFLDHSSEDVHGWGYCVFGEVVDGLDVVDKIKVVETTHRAGHDDVPVADVIIESMTVSADASGETTSTEKA